MLTKPSTKTFLWTAPDPAGDAYDAPPDPLVDWGGVFPSPFSLDVFGAVIASCRQYKLIATSLHTTHLCQKILDTPLLPYTTVSYIATAQCHYVKRPCGSLGRLRRSNLSHYICRKLVVMNSPLFIPFIKSND